MFIGGLLLGSCILFYLCRSLALAFTIQTGTGLGLGLCLLLGLGHFSPSFVLTKTERGAHENGD
jgi:hypothetical protein